MYATPASAVAAAGSGGGYRRLAVLLVKRHLPSASDLLSGVQGVRLPGHMPQIAMPNHQGAHCNGCWPLSSALCCGQWMGRRYHYRGQGHCRAPGLLTRADDVRLSACLLQMCLFHKHRLRRRQQCVDPPLDGHHCLPHAACGCSQCYSNTTLSCHAAMA